GFVAMQGELIFFRVDRQGFQPQFGARPKNSDGDLAPVGHHDLAKLHRIIPPAGQVSHWAQHLGTGFAAAICLYGSALRPSPGGWLCWHGSVFPKRWRCPFNTAPGVSAMVWNGAQQAER